MQFFSIDIYDHLIKDIRKFQTTIREGIKYAMEDMSEIRMLIIRTPPSER